ALEWVEDAPAEAGKRAWPWWLAALVCVAGGVLTKWTAPVFFYATIISLLWWRGRLRLLLSLQHVFSVAVAAGIVLGWASAVIAGLGWGNLSHNVRGGEKGRLPPVQLPAS